MRLTATPLPDPHQSPARCAPPRSRGAAIVACALMTGAATAQPQLEVAARLQQAPGNITVVPDGSVIISLHQFYQPELRVARVGADGTLTPFPNAELNGNGSPVAPIVLDSVLGLQADPDGIVWLLDNGMRNGVTPKLVAWNTRDDKLHRVIHLPPPSTVDGSFANDLAVDRTNETVYIADPAGGANAALIVVDLTTGLARRVLEGHESVIPEDVDMVIDGEPVERKLPDGSTARPRVGVNPIALDASAEWLYFGPMSGTRLYRVRTADLRNATLSTEALAGQVEPYAPRPICDGITMDVGGNIYISDVTGHAIGVIDPQRSYRQLMSDPGLISWPDAFGIAPDGQVYVACNQLHRSPALNAGENAAQPPFVILRFKGLATATTSP